MPGVYKERLQADRFSIAHAILIVIIMVQKREILYVPVSLFLGALKGGIAGDYVYHPAAVRNQSSFRIFSDARKVQGDAPFYLIKPGYYMSLPIASGISLVPSFACL